MSLVRAIGPTWRSKYQARGLERLSLTRQNAGGFYDDFTGQSRWVELTGHPCTSVVTEPGGWILINGGIAPRDTNLPAAGYALFSFESPWYLAVRAAMFGVSGDGIISLGIGGVLSDLASIGIGAQDPNTEFHLSIFLMSGWNEMVEVGVTKDELVHDFEVWCDGSKYYVSIDGHGPFSYTKTHAMVAPAVPVILSYNVKSPPTVALDKVLMVYPRSTT